LIKNSLPLIKEKSSKIHGNGRLIKIWGQNNGKSTYSFPRKSSRPEKVDEFKRHPYAGRHLYLERWRLGGLESPKSTPRPCPSMEISNLAS